MGGRYTSTNPAITINPQVRPPFFTRGCLLHSSLPDGVRGRNSPRPQPACTISPVTDTATPQQTPAVLPDPMALRREISRLAWEPDNVGRTAACLYVTVPEDYYHATTFEKQHAVLADASPSCIVGHALVNLGVPTATLFEHNGMKVRNLLLDLQADYPVDLPEARFVSDVQTAQDCGADWQLAVRIAEKLEQNRWSELPADTKAATAQ